jgi:hypothetical protein
LRAAPRASFRTPSTKRWNFARAFSHDPGTYRSGLEEKAADQIRRAGQPVYFEVYRVPFEEPSKRRHYTPDLTLLNGIVIETKGRFQTADRQKHILVKGQHPHLDIRFVFSNANARIAPKSGTTHAMWAEKNGFKWANKVIPEEWLKEPRNEASLAALARLGFKPASP